MFKCTSFYINKFSANLGIKECSKKYGRTPGTGPKGPKKT